MARYLEQTNTFKVKPGNTVNQSTLQKTSRQNQAEGNAVIVRLTYLFLRVKNKVVQSSSLELRS